jgi:protein-S-isoprenylcysteine O-methyltransferase Ste14
MTTTVWGDDEAGRVRPGGADVVSRDDELRLGQSAARRAAIFAYGLIAYAMFLVVILYTIGFVGNLFVPKTIDSGLPGAVGPSLLINGLLLGLFAVQHTIMARPAFKRWVTRIIPQAAERSTFVVASALCLGLLFWQWRPVPTVVWDLANPTAQALLIGLSLAGYAIVVIASFMVSHFDLFGVRQVYLNLQDRTYQPIPFRISGWYKLVRHPLMVGFLIAFWVTPTMTVGHLFFAAMVTGYILVGIRFEERDLVAHFGNQYREYRRRVSGLIPFPRGGA